MLALMKNRWMPDLGMLGYVGSFALGVAATSIGMVAGAGKELGLM